MPRPGLARSLRDLFEPEWRDRHRQDGRQQHKADGQKDAGPTFFIGQKVRAKDRGNIGEVIEIDGQRALVRFVGEDGVAEKWFKFSSLESLDAVNGPNGEPFKLDIAFSGDFLAADYRRRFLIKRILVQEQFCVLGGAKKSLKTSVLVALAVALASGVMFLGTFEVPVKCKVLMISTESGGATLQETLRRILLSHGLTSSAVEGLAFAGLKGDIPQLGLETHLQEIEDRIREHGFTVLIIDPAFTSMLIGSEGRAINFGNLFEVGNVLTRLANLGQRTGCTIILAHHTRKNSSADPYAPMQLEELSQSGFAEACRQWLLLSRRESYDPGSGLHKLWLNVGGSAGHSGLWSIDVDEGQPDEHLSGRTWNVDVRSATETRAEDREARKEAKRQKARHEDATAVLEVLRRYPDGHTVTYLAGVLRWNTSRFRDVVQDLGDKVEAIQVSVPCGKGTRDVEGVRLTQ